MRKPGEFSFYSSYDLFSQFPQCSSRPCKPIFQNDSFCHMSKDILTHILSVPRLPQTLLQRLSFCHTNCHVKNHSHFDTFVATMLFPTDHIQKECLVRGINKTKTAWEKDSWSLLTLLFLLKRRKYNMSKCPANNSIFHPLVLSQHTALWESCSFPSIIKYQGSFQLTTGNNYWSNKSNKIVLTYQEDISPPKTVCAHMFHPKRDLL